MFFSVNFVVENGFTLTRYKACSKTFSDRTVVNGKIMIKVYRVSKKNAMEIQQAVVHHKTG
jgi:hypothetical protein